MPQRAVDPRGETQAVNPIRPKPDQDLIRDSAIIKQIAAILAFQKIENA